MTKQQIIHKYIRQLKQDSKRRKRLMQKYKKADRRRRRTIHRAIYKQMLAERRKERE